MNTIAHTIDHTMLKADASQEVIRRYCREAREYGFASVCVNPCHVPLVARELQGSSVKTCSVVGFPLGAMSTAAKAFEAAQAVRDGAQEVDMVIAIGALKDGLDDLVREDIRRPRPHQSNHRNLPADGGRESPRLPPGSGGRRRLRENLHRLFHRRRHCGGCGSHAPDRGR